MADPTDAQDAVTKSYSDTQIQTQVAQLQSKITALQNAIVAPLPNVTIRTQIWSSTNLVVTTYTDGTPIPQVTDLTARVNLTTGAWCYYNNDVANNATYCKLYNLYAVAGIYDAASLVNTTLRKKLAPTGWHIPTDAEWITLTTCLGGESVAGSKMKDTGTVHWNSPNQDATNSSGFTGLPGGFRDLDGGEFVFIGNYGYRWSLSDFDFPNFAFSRALKSNYGIAYRYGNININGFSVRCLRD